MKGQDHYVFIKDNGKAQVIYDQGRWVTEHIRTAVLKFNYEIDKIDNLYSQQTGINKIKIATQNSIKNQNRP